MTQHDGSTAVFAILAGKQVLVEDAKTPRQHCMAQQLPKRKTTGYQHPDSYRGHF